MARRYWSRAGLRRARRRKLRLDRARLPAPLLACARGRGPRLRDRPGRRGRHRGANPRSGGAGRRGPAARPPQPRLRRARAAARRAAAPPRGAGSVRRDPARDAAALERGRALVARAPRARLRRRARDGGGLLPHGRRAARRPPAAAPDPAAPARQARSGARPRSATAKASTSTRRPPCTRRSRRLAGASPRSWREPSGPQSAGASVGPTGRRGGLPRRAASGPRRRCRSR